MLLSLVLSCGDTDTGTPPTDGAIGDVQAHDGGARDGAARDGGARDGAARDAEVDATPGADSGPRGIQAFFAQGSVGRRVMSCDGGRSWIADTSLVSEGDALVCGEVHEDMACYSDGSGCNFLNGDGECERPTANCDCDHHPGQGQGIAFGESHAVGTFGWGPPGQVLRSQDGQSWESVDEGHTFGGIAYGAGTFVLASRQPLVSTDDGATFVEGGPAEFRNGDANIWNARVSGFGDVDGGRFMIFAADGDNTDLLLSSDGGGSWWRPDARPAECRARDAGLGSVGDTLLSIGSDVSCWSSDGGTTWNVETLERSVTSVALSNTDEAYAWSNGSPTVFMRSSDGVRWTETPTEPANLQLGVVARSPDGTFVGVRSGWQRWYGEQRFYRSEDGVTWEELDEAAAPRSHRIMSITSGYVDSCP
ncbi:MAG: hypothetical protein ACI9KE_005402 [Polyangiales bacterium]|jgi:hypothetical protein